MAMIRVRNVYGIDLTVNKDAIIKASQKINNVFRQAARIFVSTAKAKSPYDPKSRHAAGKTSFPKVHHKDSIRFGTIVANKGTAGKLNEAANFGFFGVNGVPLKSAFVKSNSGRGFWLEHGTTGATSSGEFLVRKKKNARRQAYRMNRQSAAGNQVKLHYATKPQPHFKPGMAAAQRYLKANLKNVI